LQNGESNPIPVVIERCTENAEPDGTAYQGWEPKSVEPILGLPYAATARADEKWEAARDELAVCPGHADANQLCE